MLLGYPGLLESGAHGRAAFILIRTRGGQLSLMARSAVSCVSSPPESTADHPIFLETPQALWFPP